MENQEIKTEEIAAETEENKEQSDAANAEQKDKGEKIGYGTFLGSEFLMSLPLIGLVASIVIAIVSKKKSFKNYALSKMTWILVETAVTVGVVVLIFNIVGNIVVGTLNNTLGTQFEDVNQLVTTVADVKQEKYSSAVAQLENTVGDNYKPFVKELSTGKYEDLLKQVKYKQYDVVLAEFKSDNHPELMATLDDATYNNILNELEKAANGEQRDWMEKFKALTEFDIASLLNKQK